MTFDEVHPAPHHGATLGLASYQGEESEFDRFDNAAMSKEMGAPGLDAGVPGDRSSSLGWFESWENWMAGSANHGSRCDARSLIPSPTGPS